mmetsp:Transcript_20020/g.40094  ORF Transcript_20020/g.40094 Transcript_20020/m.40094 type:complete len:139 (-) Transcript_20020:466-882(-)
MGRIFAVSGSPLNVVTTLPLLHQPASCCTSMVGPSPSVPLPRTRGITVGLAQALRSNACQGDTDVFALAYCHPPTSPHPAPLEDVVACYKQLLSTTQPLPAVVLAGDSLGGALAVQALANIRDDPTLPNPTGALLLSP